jgi:6-pyruvoyltetrahydropterin/6-carboxytetrahydropterin synthase
MSEITIKPAEEAIEAGLQAQAEVFREFTFEAAHRLPFVPEDHKCARLHGHSYRVEVRVSGPIGDRSGWVVDFADLKAAWKSLHDTLDHHYLNEIPGLDNPTSENLARWIWERLSLNLDGLEEVIVRETCTSGCSFRGEVK